MYLQKVKLKKCHESHRSGKNSGILREKQTLQPAVKTAEKMQKLVTFLRVSIKDYWY